MATTQPLDNPHIAELAQKYGIDRETQHHMPDEPRDAPRRMATTATGANQAAMAAIQIMHDSIRTDPAPPVPLLDGNHPVLGTPITLETLAYWETNTLYAVLVGEADDTEHFRYYHYRTGDMPLTPNFAAHAPEYAQYVRGACTEGTFLTRTFHADIANPQPSATPEEFLHQLQWFHGTMFAQRKPNQYNPYHQYYPRCQYYPGHWRKENYAWEKRYYTPPAQIPETLKALWRLAQTLPPGPSRGELIKFGIHEIQPFHDGNSLVARRFGNLEISTQHEMRCFRAAHREPPDENYELGIMYEKQNPEPWRESRFHDRHTRAESLEERPTLPVDLNRFPDLDIHPEDLTHKAQIVAELKQHGYTNDIEAPFIENPSPEEIRREQHAMQYEKQIYAEFNITKGELIAGNDDDDDDDELITFHEPLFWLAMQRRKRAHAEGRPVPILLPCNPSAHG